MCLTQATAQGLARRASTTARPATAKPTAAAASITITSTLIAPAK